MEKEPYIGRKIDYERYQDTTSEDLISEILEQKLEEPTTKIKEEELYKETVVQSTQQVVSRGIDSKLRNKHKHIIRYGDQLLRVNHIED